MNFQSTYIIRDAELSPSMIYYNNLLQIYKKVNREKLFGILNMMGHDVIEGSSLWRDGYHMQKHQLFSHMMDGVL